MPVYEYECQKCHHHFEVLQNIKEKPLKKCKECGGKVERLISQTSFALKGSGWYRDGYSKTENKSENKSDKKTAGASSSSKAGTQSSDSKVA